MHHDMPMAGVEGDLNVMPDSRAAVLYSSSSVVHCGPGEGPGLRAAHMSGSRGGRAKNKQIRAVDSCDPPKRYGDSVIPLL
jgi:hypothetical protein